MNPTPPNQEPSASLLHGPLTEAFAGLEPDRPTLRADEYPGGETSDKSCTHTSVPNVCEVDTSSKSCPTTSENVCPLDTSNRTCQTTSDPGCLGDDTGNPACQSTSERGCLGADTGNRTCQSTSDADCRSALPPGYSEGWSTPPPAFG